jgi:hypothetical protein
VISLYDSLCNITVLTGHTGHIKPQTLSHLRAIMVLFYRELRIFRTLARIMPAMGSHSRRRRGLGGKAPDGGDVIAPDASRRAGVTHRSPAPDSPELPCCGRTVLDMPARDQVTTDPALVTCDG